MKGANMKSIILLLICSCLPFCSGPGKKDQDGFTLKSPAFKYGQKIPVQYTCNGKNISPEMVWNGVPKDTKCLALTCEDLAGQGRAVHWVIYNIPPTSKGLPQNIPQRAKLPDGPQQAYNMFSLLGYMGPCPGNKTNNYVFRLYALNSKIEEEPPLSSGKVILFIDDHTLAKAELMGTYR
jgi:Raf kinase inhibitor-like YbhB/YbcL family protein